MNGEAKTTAKGKDIPPIVTAGTKENEKFLHKKTVPFDFSKRTRGEISTLLNRMRATMKAANGIGLSANQIGLDVQVFVAQVPAPQGGSKFYAVFNPKIEKVSGEKLLLEEGCLSVPRKYGRVERHERLTLKGQDKNGRPLKIKAWGLLAHVFQHETDHLNGILFIDKAKEVYETPRSERLREREEN
jgi:peptide deformylase